MRQRVLAGLVIAAALATSAQAGPFEDGVAAFRNGDYAAAHSAWLGLAEAGDVTARFNLGLMYHQGRGVAKDTEAAAHWYRLAAEQGDPQAAFNLGLINEAAGDSGLDEALRWFRIAAEGRDSLGQVRIGSYYAQGKVMAQDHAEAAKWYELAAKQNNMTALFSLGTMYANGQGVPRDLSRANELYELAEATSCIVGPNFDGHDVRFTPASVGG